MDVLTTSGWKDYELIDSGNRMRLERYGNYVIAKPDPQAIWNESLPKDAWHKADAVYQNGQWEKASDFPSKWKIGYKNLSFYAKLTAFKHTGIFPEQTVNWRYIEDKISGSKTQPNVLNLFAYTGAASLVAAKEGAKVTHLDGSKPSIAWAKENQKLSGLTDKPIRWIEDDALEFTFREIRRGNTYDGIIMDPPVYGHGPKGQIWDFDKNFPTLLENCTKILTPKPLFVIVNSYAVTASAIMLKNLLEDYFKVRNIEYGELALSQKNGRLLSTGIFARFSSNAELV